MQLTDLQQRENKMISFIDEVDKYKRSVQAENKWKETPKFKLKEIANRKGKAEDVCFNKIFCKIYKDALPLEDDYKCAHSEELDNEICNFLQQKNDKGISFYMREMIEKSEPVRRMVESVQNLVNDFYYEAEMDVNTFSVDDSEFDPNSEENIQKINEINSNMEFDEISEVIKNNVKRTTMNEIQRSKDEKEKLDNLEKELTNNPEVTSEAAINRELAKHGYLGEKKVYQPSLFNGIMINKSNIIKESCPDMDVEHRQKLAFVESVKEYTKLSILDAFKMEKFTPARVRNLANDYATMRIR